MAYTVVILDELCGNGCAGFSFLLRSGFGGGGGDSVSACARLKIASTPEFLVKKCCFLQVEMMPAPFVEKVICWVSSSKMRPRPWFLRCTCSQPQNEVTACLLGIRPLTSQV